MSKKATLRCCASCMWVYRGPTKPCPQCGWASYGARFALGPACYRYEVTQKPWFDRQMDKRRQELWAIINAAPKPNRWQQFLAVRAEIEGRPCCST
jgi:hypothetical protein